MTGGLFIGKQLARRGLLEKKPLDISGIIRLPNTGAPLDRPRKHPSLRNDFADRCQRMSSSLVRLVIPAYNEGRRLPDYLPQLVRSSLQGFVSVANYDR